MHVIRSSIENLVAYLPRVDRAAQAALIREVFALHREELYEHRREDVRIVFANDRMGMFVPAWSSADRRV